MQGVKKLSNIQMEQKYASPALRSFITCWILLSKYVCVCWVSNKFIQLAVCRIVCQFVEMVLFWISLSNVMIIIWLTMTDAVINAKSSQDSNVRLLPQVLTNQVCVLYILMFMLWNTITYTKYLVKTKPSYH